ncbi:MAG: hypothetical protein RL483_1047 [Pseudomonadota bacterium]|jgi:uncharacterized protein YigA (DUF484 family)
MTTPQEPRLGQLPAPELNDQSVAQYLRAHPDFLIRHPAVLAELQVPHLQAGAASSLLERQLLVLREKIKALEHRTVEMVRHAQENDAISDKLMTWLRSLLLQASPVARADELPLGLARAFNIPVVGLGLWRGPAVKDLDQTTDLARPSWSLAATDELAQMTEALSRPLCLPVKTHQAGMALRLLHDQEVQSLALLPLRQGASPQAFGLLVLASSDPGRFTPDHGTAFLERIAELSSAALLGLSAQQSDPTA